ncbi:MAG TPA: alpha/beta hydrolase [Steroidobacteraceae bacterium]|nr:alpha/beta hydrolase [Steroidobacteraceae bacterium]
MSSFARRRLIDATTVLLIAMATLLAGCGSKEPAPTAEPAAQAAAAVADGAPRIATSADGVHVQYRVYGKGEPTLVLVHGWSCDSTYWNAQVEALRDKYTVVTVDLAGHGASGSNRTDWTMARYGDDVAAAVADLPSQQLILIGHSMGGPVVIEAAQRLRGRVLAAIGVDTFKSVGSPPPPSEQVAALVGNLERDFIGTTRDFVAKTFFTKDADPQLVNKIAMDMAAGPPDVAIASMRSLATWDPGKGLTVPIIAINADLGLLTDDARIRSVWPTFRSVTMPNTGHFLMMEEPQAFNAVLQEQIADLQQPSAP